MRAGRRTGGQTAAAQRGAFAPCAARQLAEARDAVWRCAAQRAVRPSAARDAVRRCAARLLAPARAPRAVRALREARELRGRGARLALLLLAYAARLRLSP